MEDFNDRQFIQDKYKNSDLVRLINQKQVAFYMKNGVFPLWVDIGYNDRIVYVFLKQPTLMLFSKWRNYETGDVNEKKEK